MKVIIMCAGKGERWGNEPKELAIVQDSPNILRTRSMLDEKPTVIISESKMKYYKNFALKIVIGSDKREIDRFRNVFNILVEDTVILYGDVVYQKDDLQTILKTPEVTTFYGRKGKNTLTGKPYGEILGVHVIDTDQFTNAVNQVAKLFEEGKIPREIGWEVYKQLNDIDPAIRSIPHWDNFIELSERTDDYDTPQEYELVTKNVL